MLLSKYLRNQARNQEIVSSSLPQLDDSEPVTLFQPTSAHDTVVGENRRWKKYWVCLVSGVIYKNNEAVIKNEYLSCRIYALIDRGALKNSKGSTLRMQPPILRLFYMNKHSRCYFKWSGSVCRLEQTSHFELKTHEMH